MRFETGVFRIIQRIPICNPFLSSGGNMSFSLCKLAYTFSNQTKYYLIETPLLYVNKRKIIPLNQMMTTNMLFYHQKYGLVNNLIFKFQGNKLRIHIRTDNILFSFKIVNFSLVSTFIFSFAMKPKIKQTDYGKEIIWRFKMKNLLFSFKTLFLSEKKKYGLLFCFVWFIGKLYQGR